MDMDITHLDDQMPDKVRRMIRGHASNWSGHLVGVSATQHRIELKPGVAPVHARP